MKVLLVFIYSFLAFGHGNEVHEEKAIVTNLDKSKNLTYKKINSDYIEKVKPIFKRSCFDCHGTVESFPWYYKLPVVKGFIDKDIADAKEHVDFTSDFPFKSHDTVINDLKSIKKDIQENEMPPFEYRVMHIDKKLSEQEKIKIIKWVDESLELLRDE